MPAVPLLAEALAFFDALRIEVMLGPCPKSGRWRYTIKGQSITEGELVARAFVLGMAGPVTVQ